MKKGFLKQKRPRLRSRLHFLRRSLLIRLKLLLIVGLVFPASSQAGDVSTQLENLGRDLIAPIRKPRLMIGGTVLSLTTYPLSKTSFQKDIAESRPLGEASNIGYQLGFWRSNVAYVAGVSLYGWISGDSAAYGKAILMARASIYTSLLTQGLKALHMEERPRRGGDFGSFPSGHASNAFVMAGVIYRNHGIAWGVGSFAVASFIGFSRMNDNAHYLHDVLFGATLGLGYAFGLDGQWGQKDDEGVARYQLFPILAGSSTGLGVQIRLN
ncbi:MAG: phosphatase PAP2 family protein [Bdellovibrionales bacterium]|nr:phosphatase PAP2 family protein [Bdellovibrionales bacterium]